MWGLVRALGAGGFRVERFGIWWFWVLGWRRAASGLRAETLILGFRV